jgi:hypothetical protein
MLWLFTGIGLPVIAIAVGAIVRPTPLVRGIVARFASVACTESPSAEDSSPTGPTGLFTSTAR